METQARVRPRLVLHLAPFNDRRKTKQKKNPTSVRIKVWQIQMTRFDGVNDSEGGKTASKWDKTKWKIIKT